MGMLSFFSKTAFNNCRSSASKCLNIRVLESLKRFCSTKPHCNIGTIGHIDHGKTTLTSAITKILGNDGTTRFVSYDQIDKAPEEKARGITINACHVEYITDKRHYAHTDCPGHLDFIKNMIVGTSQMDGAILVVAATDGVMPQTREHIQLAKQIGVKDIVVFINKADLVDKETVELAEMEVAELLDEMGFDSKKVPFISGSALCALQGTKPELGEESIRQLVKVIDEKVTVPERRKDGQFVMPINTAFTVKGRGTVAVGTVQQGILNKGEAIHVVGLGNDLKSHASDLQIFQKSVRSTVAGDNVGILLRGVKKDLVQRGMFICTTDPKRGTIPTQTECFLARCYIQSKSEGGRTKPITSGFRGMMFVDTWNIDCTLTLLPPDYEEEVQGENIEAKEADVNTSKENANAKETQGAESSDESSKKLLAMPGDVTFAKIFLRKPMILRAGQRFFVREREKTSITGIVTEIKPDEKKQIKGFNWEPPKRHTLVGNCSTILRRRRSQ